MQPLRGDRFENVPEHTLPTARNKVAGDLKFGKSVGQLDAPRRPAWPRRSATSASGRSEICIYIIRNDDSTNDNDSNATKYGNNHNDNDYNNVDNDDIDNRSSNEVKAVARSAQTHDETAAAWICIWTFEHLKSKHLASLKFTFY